MIFFFKYNLHLLNTFSYKRVSPFVIITSCPNSAYIALDDIELFPGTCYPSPGSTPLPQTTPAPESKLTCSFEEDFCGWSQDTADSGNWELINGVHAVGDDGDGLGPAVDHTSHLSAGEQAPGSRAWSSPV